MSDNCEWGVDAWNDTHVLGIADVAWYATDPEAHISFFVRQKYRTNRETGAYDFQRLRSADFHCPCKIERSDMDDVRDSYSIGDSVLVRRERPGQDEFLEPAQIIDISDTQDVVTLRRLIHPGDLSQSMPRNQLAVSDDTYCAPAFSVVRMCHIRVFPSNDAVVAPFDNDGAGDFYYIIATDVKSSFPALKLYKTPTEGIPEQGRLRGLGMFCGGGSLDRGLEDGGAVDFKYAIDWQSEALHTYSANVKLHADTQMFLGFCERLYGPRFPRVP